MRKLWFILLILVGCGTSSQAPLNQWMNESENLKVLATTAQVGDLVAGVGGDRIDLWVLIQGELDPHSYELVKGDGEKFGRADLVFFSGLGLEHGASLSEQLKSHRRSLGIADAIQTRSPEKILYKDGQIDPHLWMDISLWKEGIDPVVSLLSAADPEGAGYYRERGERLKESFSMADEHLRQTLHRVPQEQRYLVTSHDAFQYFARSYLAQEGEADWKERVAAPEGLAPDGQLNPADIQCIIAFLREHSVHVIFPESNVSRDSIKKICSAGKELHLEIRICREPLYGDTMGNLKYLEMMQHNGDVITCNLLSSPTN
jgi:manganese/zinc/iron transport system substrate-binding protein